jgi:RND family efflux transporter MFP subunit
MKTTTRAILGVLLFASAAGYGGYWFGTRHAIGTPSVGANVLKTEPQILFYRNPMGLPDTSPVPKKDSMGMDYIPVREGEQDEEPGTANQIKISVEKVQKLGVRTEVASLRALDRSIRSAGRIEPDERRMVVIAPKFEGYVERLHVNATGQPVTKGQALFEAYSPELVSAQREYAIAQDGVKVMEKSGPDAQNSMRQLAQASLSRLRNLDVSEEQLKELAASGAAKRTLTFRSPVSGIVTEKKALQGQRFMPGELLFQITDLSSVWVIADVSEQDIGVVRTGAKAKVQINAYPEKSFEGAVTYIYPTMNPATRTIPVRVELSNPALMLKPGMFAQVALPVGGSQKVVAIPASAIIDSGTRQIALVQLKEGRFEPRQVKIGARGSDYVEVIEGVREGELVVVSANFLIDAESNLKAAISGFGQSQSTGVQPAAGAQIPSPTPNGNKAVGKIVEIDATDGTLTISHGPVESLHWPAMTMGFKLANREVAKGFKTGDPIAFEFVERAKGEWVITSAKPGAGPDAMSKP